MSEPAEYSAERDTSDVDGAIAHRDELLAAFDSLDRQDIAISAALVALGTHHVTTYAGTCEQLMRSLLSSVRQKSGVLEAAITLAEKRIEALSAEDERGTGDDRAAEYAWEHR